MTGPDLVALTEGALTVTLGAVLTTVKVALGPAAAAKPARFDALPAASDMPRVPSPERLDIVTVHDPRWCRRPKPFHWRFQSC